MTIEIENSFVPYAEINVNKLENNAKRIKDSLGDKKLIAVVKSDAYGHGMQSAEYLNKFCDAFAVSRLNEAQTLRYMGIEKPIMTLIPLCNSQLKFAGDYDLTVPCFSLQFAKEIAKRTFSKQLKINFKVDCGMKRMGFSNFDEFEESLKILSYKKNIKIESLYSHFSNGEDLNCCDKEFKRFQLFEKIFENYCDGYKHISASSGFLHEKFNLDGVRIGLLLYGYKPFESKFKVEKVMRIVAKPILNSSFDNCEKCLYNSNVEKGDYSLVNYGYADGLFRRSNPTRCMDLSLIKNHVENDLVVIMDDASVFAKNNSTITYEVLVKSATRLNKKYIR